MHNEPRFQPHSGMLLMSVLASEERTYILQNWRADVVATTRANGEVIEKIQYTPYGSALTHLLTFTARADFNSDGGVDGADIDAFTAAWANSEPSADVDQSGGVDGGDVELFYTLWANSANQEYYETQPGACQTTSIRFGYAGYVRDASVNNGGDVSTFGERNYTGAMAGLYHVRHRAYDPELGRWTRRDPIGYVDGMGLYQYVRGNPIVHGDASGSCAESLGGCKSDFGISMSIGQSSSLDTLTSGGVVVTPVPFTWCVNLIGYAVCRAACSAADADERATATGIRNLCLAAANLVYSGCMGTCLSPAGTPLPTPYCASWEFVCDTLKVFRPIYVMQCSWAW